MLPRISPLVRSIIMEQAVNSSPALNAVPILPERMPGTIPARVAWSSLHVCAEHADQHARQALQPCSAGIIAGALPTMTSRIS